LPTPQNTFDLLAKQLAEAAHEDIRKDDTTDEAERGPFLKSAVTRGEQPVGDRLHLTLNMMHWSRIDSTKIELPMELTLEY
jgi:hypothetical protein